MVGRPRTIVLAEQVDPRFRPPAEPVWYASNPELEAENAPTEIKSKNRCTASAIGSAAPLIRSEFESNG
jgi:hypothetical protein